VLSEQQQQLLGLIDRVASFERELPQAASALHQAEEHNRELSARCAR